MVDILFWINFPKEAAHRPMVKTVVLLIVTASIGLYDVNSRPKTL